MGRPSKGQVYRPPHEAKYIDRPAGHLLCGKTDSFSTRFARLFRLHSGKLDCFAVFEQLPSVEAAVQTS